MSQETELTPQQALQLAIERHRGGDFATAETIYRQILAAMPQQPDALHLLAVACRQQGRLDEALPMFARCVELTPDNPDLRGNYGEALTAAGDPAAAERQLREALKRSPRHVQALNNLGLALQAQGKMEQAIAAGRRAVDIQPNHASARNNLGNYLLATGHPAEAAQHFHSAQQLDPANGDIASNLVVALEEAADRVTALACAVTLLTMHPGNARLHSAAGRLLWWQERFDEALAQFAEAVKLDPNDAGTWNNYGLALHDAGRADEAITAYRRAAALDPAEPGAWSNLGITLKEQGAISESLQALNEALLRQPDHAESWSNLGMVLEIAGRADDAVAAYRRAIELAPALERAHSNLVFALNYLPDIDAASIAAAHRQWATQHVAQLYPSAACTTQVNNRRLRVGFISADLRSHPVGYLLQPYFTHYNRQAIELFVYADVINSDDLTACLQRHAEHWRDITGHRHQDVAAQVSSDGVDVLVDLAGHSARNRLPVFAMKPAPVQASWVGYFNTTGLATMDFFVTDEESTPAELLQHFSERPLYLPHTRFCYSAPAYTPPVSPLPAPQTGHITFGCFNNLAKLNHHVIAAWAEILRHVAGSRLLLKSLALNDAQVQLAIIKQFAAHQIGAEQLELRGHSPHAVMLAEYGDVDIALDPFPFAGGITSCEALYMGVPVITLCGLTLAGRQGHSLLNALNLQDWSVSSIENYIALAVTKSHDHESLSLLRQQLRQRFLNSPLGDARGFAEAVDQAWANAYGLPPGEYRTR